MSDNVSTKKYPGAAPEIGEILGLGKENEDPGHGHENHVEPVAAVKTAPHPANLPVVDAEAKARKSVDAELSPKKADELSHAGAHSDQQGILDIETLEEEQKQKSPAIVLIKTIAPYIAVFIVGLGLYYFFLSKTDFGEIFSNIKSTTNKVAQTPKETALETLMNNNLKAYELWVGQYYFDVSDSAVIDPKADNSGNGLSNFQKFLLGLNPRSYDTLGLGMADSEAIAQNINPLTGGSLTDKQKDLVNKYFDMEVIMNRLTISHRSGNVAGSSTEGGLQVRSSGQQTFAQTISSDLGVNARGEGFSGNVVRTTNVVVNQPVAISSNVQPDNSNINTGVTGHLEIPSLNVSAPIVWSSNPKNFDKDLQSGVIHYPGTAMPGQVGTSYISGHSSNVAWAKGSYNQVFSKLGNLADNTSFTITITNKDGKKVKQHYVVRRRGEYKATDQEQFKNAGVPTVALSTCWPVNTTQRRLVVFGELTQIEQ